MHDEEGYHFVDQKDKIRGRFPVDLESGDSGACDIDILRHELSTIFYDSSKSSTEYIFGDRSRILPRMTPRRSSVRRCNSRGRDDLQSSVARLPNPKVA